MKMMEKKTKKKATNNRKRAAQPDRLDTLLLEVVCESTSVISPRLPIILYHSRQ